MKKAAIEAIRYYLPATTVTNEDLAPDCGDWDAAKILAKTGIAKRHVAAANECASDLGVAAAQRLFAETEFEPKAVDFLIFCTQSPDYVMPPTGCLVHEQLGLRNDSGAVDLNLGCSGFIYGLALAKSMIESGVAANVLLITAETYSKIINRRDRSARTVFGDGAAATFITAAEIETEYIGPFIFGTNGAGAEEIIVRAGGARRAISAEAMIETQDRSGSWRADKDFYMNGPEVFNFVLAEIPRALRRLIDRWGGSLNDVNYFVFHQANRFILEHLRNKLNIPPERFCIDVENYGNTVSSTIPIALENARVAGHVRSGDTVAILGFGVGYSWSGAILKLS
ncbi:MAG: 3-oxoacyl-ACP synthase III family protein [Chthoniobacterales bacterium]